MKFVKRGSTWHIPHWIAKSTRPASEKLVLTGLCGCSLGDKGEAKEVELALENPGICRVCIQLLGARRKLQVEQSTVVPRAPKSLRGQMEMFRGTP